MTDAEAAPGSESPLGSAPVTVCLGSGGVGKTTVAAALALQLARRGERVVVLTIDPARRLADALGLEENLGNEPVQIRTWENGGELWATMLDPAETLQDVIRTESTSTEQADTIMGTTLFANLASSLSGTNEYMAAERLHQLHGDERFDRVVVDTPPSRHGLDFLESPGRLHRFIDHRLYRSVFAPSSGVMRTVGVGSRLILRLLGRIVGGRLVEEVIAFFSNFQGLDQGFQARADSIKRVLDTETGFVLVAAPRSQPLEEARWIADRLASPLTLVVLNRMCPVEPATGDGTDPGVGDGNGSYGSDNEEADPLVRNLRQLALMAVHEQRLVGSFLADVPAPRTIRLPEQARPIHNLDDIGFLADRLD